MHINAHFRDLPASYLFSEVAKRRAAFAAEHPDARVISLGIGDVTRPLAPVVVDALRQAAAEMGDAATMRGYGPENGYGFLREAIAGYYATLGVAVDPAEIQVGDGAKSDLGNILDIISTDDVVAIPDPVYPVYVDTNIMDGRRIVLFDGTVDNGFAPLPTADLAADVVYLCSPNNPTGAVYDKAGLTEWVEWANARGAVILFDAAYESFITDPALPHSIFEIDGARECAIEFCSLSKKAGFTGLRCGYTVIPAGLQRDGVALGALWARRQATKFNGVSYPVQRAAEAVFTPDGLAQNAANTRYYLDNAAILSRALTELGVWFTGGEQSPYVWLRCPEGLDSWGLFDDLLTRAALVGTPGSGFGSQGEGFFRLTSFGNCADVEEAVTRLPGVLG